MPITPLPLNKPLFFGVTNRSIAFWAVLFALFDSSSAKPTIIDSRTRNFRFIMPGKAITLQKLYDPETGQAALKSTDGSIQSGQDLARLEDADREAYRRQYGRLTESLAAKLDAAQPRDQIRALVTLKPPASIKYPERGTLPPEEMKRKSLDAAAAKPPRSIGAVIAPYSAWERIDLSDYTAAVQATPAALRAMAMDPESPSSRNSVWLEPACPSFRK